MCILAGQRKSRDALIFNDMEFHIGLLEAPNRGCQNTAGSPQAQAEEARNERQKEADNQKIIAALQRINNSQQAYAQQRNTDDKRVATRERRRFWLDVAGVWVNVAGITVALAAAGSSCGSNIRCKASLM